MRRVEVLGVVAGTVEPKPGRLEQHRARVGPCSAMSAMSSLSSETSESNAAARARSSSATTLAVDAFATTMKRSSPVR